LASEEIAGKTSFEAEMEICADPVLTMMWKQMSVCERTEYM